MYTAVCDLNEIRPRFGLEIDAFERMVVFQRAEEMRGTAISRQDAKNGSARGKDLELSWRSASPWT